MAPIETPQETVNYSAQALQLLEDKDHESLSALVDELHPVELVAVINSVEPDLQSELIKHITGLDQVADLVAYSDEILRKLALDLLDDSRIAAVVRRLEIDDAADVMGLLARRRQVRILRRLGAPTVKQLTSLLAYEQETAGGIMTPLFLHFEPDLSTEEAIKELRRRLLEEEIDSDTDIGYVYITDAAQNLKGICSLRQVLASPSGARLSELMTTDIIGVSPEDDQEHVARLIADYDFSSIPVISPENGRMLGIITIDDVLDVIVEEHTEDLLRLAGTEDDDTVGASTFVAIKSRLPWLMASWLGGIGGAALLGSFGSTLEKLVTLAFFMPVVFGMGGNVGSQSSTITVRGLAMGILGKHRIASRLRKEALVGASLGLTFGILLSSVAILFYKDVNLAIIVGCSIMATMTCSAALGSMLPVIFDRLGFDPAVASGPFVTTSTDILSITIYFSTASVFL